MLRDATPSDWPAILALNQGDVHFLSPLDEARLTQLAAAACYLRVVEEQGTVAAFLLGFAQGAEYDSPNYRWFDARYDTFLYVAPPNPASLAFHARRGFREIGRIPYGEGKTVALLLRDLE